MGINYTIDIYRDLLHKKKSQLRTTFLIDWLCVSY